MGHTVYIARDDNKTLFAIGTWKHGFAEYFAEHTYQPLPPFHRLWRDLYAAIVSSGTWDMDPHETATYAKQFAERIIRWSKGQPVHLNGSGEKLKGYRENGDCWFQDIEFKRHERVALYDGRTGVVQGRVWRGWRDPDYRVRIDGTGLIERTEIKEMSRLGLLYQLIPD